jgi:hypothetical protein
MGHAYRLTLAAAAVIAAASAPAGVLTEPSPVADCRPCEIDGGKAGRWTATFDTVEADGERVIRSIRLRKGNAKELVLAVNDMTPVPKGETFFFGPVDINFDGCQDLMVLVNEGVANEYAEYWVFDGKRSTWVPAGRYPVFKVDGENKRLSTFERGGYGGRIYERNEFTSEGLKPVLVRSEKQTLLRAPDQFRRIVSERINGRMRVVRQRTVSGSEPMEPATKVR